MANSVFGSPVFDWRIHAPSHSFSQMAILGFWLISYFAHHLVAATMLGCVQRSVRLLQQLDNAFLSGGLRDSDADSDSNVVLAVPHRRVSHMGPETLGQLKPLLQFGIAEQNNQLFSAIAGNKIRLAQLG